MIFNLIEAVVPEVKLQKPRDCCKENGVPRFCLGLCSPAPAPAARAIAGKRTNACSKHEAVIEKCFEDAFLNVLTQGTNINKHFNMFSVSQITFFIFNTTICYSNHLQEQDESLMRNQGQWQEVSARPQLSGCFVNYSDKQISCNSRSSICFKIYVVYPYFVYAQISIENIKQKFYW